MAAPQDIQAQQSEGGPAEQTGQYRLPRLFWALVLLIAWAIWLLLLIWQVLAIFYSNLPAWLAPIAALATAIAGIAIVVMVKPRWRAGVAFALWSVCIAGLWMLIPPSNDRDWQKDVAILPWAEISNDVVVINNIRNCNYRSETDFDVRHYNKTYDLGKLRSVDLVFCQWGPKNIAHTMLSFGFDGGDYLCFSVETRKKVGQSYSTIKGFFKQYELTYVVADERDLIGLRTNHRGEQVSIYPLLVPEKIARAVFLDYLREVNSLKAQPEWYNALTSNCTTNIRNHTVAQVHGAWDWRMLINGDLPELLLEARRGLFGIACQ